jgi:hypothetical protein
MGSSDIWRGGASGLLYEFNEIILAVCIDCCFFYQLPNGNHSDWLIIHGNPGVLAYQTGQITRDRERMTRSLKRSLIEILMVR